MRATAIAEVDDYFSTGQSDMTKSSVTEVRIYNNESIPDQYTVVFDGNYVEDWGKFVCIKMNAQPYDPQGVGEHGFSNIPIEEEESQQLGSRISFWDLPTDCQSVTVKDYAALCELEPTGCLKCGCDSAYDITNIIGEVGEEPGEYYCLNCGDTFYSDIN